MDRVDRERLLERLRGDAARIADHFGLQYSAIEAEHPRVKARYGVCYDTGLVKIRLNHARTGKPLKYSSLIDTLCHELAHLRHFDHGPAFKRFYLRLLSWARQQGIYCPASRRGPASSLAQIRQPRRLPERNGVPVFSAPAPASSNDDGLLPWERRAASLQPQRPAARPPNRSRPAARKTAAPPAAREVAAPAPAPVAAKPEGAKRGHAEEALPLWSSASQRVAAAGARPPRTTSASAPVQDGAPKAITPRTRESNRPPGQRAAAKKQQPAQLALFEPPSDPSRS